VSPRAVVRAGALVALALAAGGAARAQGPLGDRIAAVRDGTVRFAYAVREGICGDGETFIRDRSRGDDNVTTFDARGGREWRHRDCEPGPARVSITQEKGEVIRVRLYVGGAWGRPDGNVTDLGTVPAPTAAKALIALASRQGRSDRAIFAATIADSAVVWPELLALAKNETVSKSVRKDAVFWLSQFAGDAATKGLADLAEDERQDRDVREQAVFALSQLAHDQGVPILIRVARSNRDPALRRKALFWLGQSDDPRALGLFEEILTGKR
jgi:HEAT repeat protein